MEAGQDDHEHNFACSQPRRRSRPSQASSRPRIQVAPIAGLMIALSSRRSITLNVSDCAEPGSALGVIDEQARQIEHARHPGDDGDD